MLSHMYSNIHMHVHMCLYTHIYMYIYLCLAEIHGSTAIELGKIMRSMTHSIRDVERHFLWPVHVNITTFSKYLHKKKTFQTLNKNTDLKLSDISTKSACLFKLAPILPRRSSKKNYDLLTSIPAV